MKTRYLKAAERLKSQYTALWPLLDAVNFIISIVPPSSLSVLQSFIKVGGESIFTQSTLKTLKNFEFEAKTIISNSMSELQKRSERDGEKTYSNDLVSLKDKLSDLKVPFQQPISFKDLILITIVSSYELLLSAYTENADRYKLFVETFFAEILLIQKKERTAQSVLATVQAKCEDLSEAIGKSISGLQQVFKASLIWLPSQSGEAKSP